MEHAAPHLRDEALLRLDRVVVEYKLDNGRKVHAVSDVSLDIVRGETLGLVGESGCGKSTIGKSIVMLHKPTSGTVTFEGRELASLRFNELRRMRHKLQMIFQDPISSLNPRRKVRTILTEGLSINHAAKPWDGKVDEALSAVGLDPAAVANRHPNELSGGQCQRVAIARALLLDPELIVCDEPVSALDVSVQAQILNILEDMKERYGLTLLFISHDLAVVKNVSDRVAVMYLGKLCEVARADLLYGAPQHPYTQALLYAIPDPDPFADEPPMLAAGEPASPIDPPSGCRFRTRCPHAQEICVTDEPALRETAADHYVACHFAGELDLTGQSPASADAHGES